jgi:hypothetical protein
MAKTDLPDKIVITIKPAEESITVEETAGGVTSAKGISHDSLVTCFEKSIKEPKRLDSGFLPDNCLAVSFTAGNKYFVIRHPLLRADITYHQTVYENFPIPRMVFGFVVARDGRVTGCKVAAVADEKPVPETRVYEWPFSNVFNDGRICTGAANSLPVHKTGRTLSSLPHFILALPNNDHNFNRGHNKMKLGYRELLDYMKDKEPSHYYEQVLIPKKAGTLGKFIDEQGGML